MSTKFDGKKIRDEILRDLKKQIANLSVAPKLAVIWSGNNLVSEKYINSKKKVAANLGAPFLLFELKTEKEIIDKILDLNADESVSGVMVQMPLADGIDRHKVIAAISAEKDVDGLRYCSGLESGNFPPVILAILEAIKNSGVSLIESSVVVVGLGFLVGASLSKILKDQVADLRLVDDKVKNLSELTVGADIIISATGQKGIITPVIMKDGAILIDAGTTEVSGTISGDIDPSCYEKSRFYTPVPGGIGPVTVAMLYRNLIDYVTRLT